MNSSHLGGGGVAAKVRIVGPQQERWIRLLDTIDRDEVTRALNLLLRESGGVANAAPHLHVSPEFLSRRTGASKTRTTRATRLPAFRWPRTPEEVAPILRVVIGGEGSGLRGGASTAWRISGLLEDARSHAATVEAMRRAAAACTDLSDVARAFGVTRMVLWKWRRRWPDLEVVLADKSGTGGKKALVGNRVDGKRRLSLEAAIDLMRPHLPGKASEVSDRIRAAIAAGRSPHGVAPTARELSYYVGKPDSRGLMVARWADRIGKAVVHVWTLVDTARGERLDGRSSAKRGVHHCTNCGKPGHNRVKCPNNDRERKSDGKEATDKKRRGRNGD